MSEASGPDVGHLPWEHAGDPSRTGICLSGGGIRAASFGLGVLQALQAERGLLFGPHAAEYLAVVSGGSYVGATATLNAARLAADASLPMEPAPLDVDSPEAKHLVSNGEYLTDGGTLRTAIRFGLPAILNFAAFVVLFLWVGTMLASYAWVAEEVSGGGLSASSDDTVWLAATVALVGGAILFRGIYKDGGLGRTLMPLVGLALVFVAGPSLVAAMQKVEPLSNTAWWGEWWRPVGFFALALLVAGLWWLTAKLVPARGVARVVARLAVFMPRAAGLILLGLATTAAFDVLDGGTSIDASDKEAAAALGAYFAVLFGGVLFSAVSGRVSLHSPYRGQLSQCFAVQRDGETVRRLPATSTSLSELAPPAEGSERSFPRLLICATANVVWRRPDGRKRTFAPFVYSHDRCGIPGTAQASFATERLEAGRVPAGISTRSSEPLVSLMTGVASTGAAVSPSMGKMTVPALRPLIAIANIRLGRWLPNPLSERIRNDVEGTSTAWSPSKRKALGGGYDEFLPELLGLHRADAPTVYVSDGGHYDNLGLLALLCARCEVIWCVDSEADKRGRANQLRRVVKFAADELGTRIDLDVDRFSGKAGLLGASHVVGSITYPGGKTGQLIVIKLGLTDESPGSLREYQASDKKFPYHSTFRYLSFSPSRMDAYRQLGAVNARAAMEDVPAPPAEDVEPVSLGTS